MSDHPGTEEVHMPRLTRDQQLEQIRADARRHFEARPCPEPTVEQMRRVGQVLRARREGKGDRRELTIGPPPPDRQTEVA